MIKVTKAIDMCLRWRTGRTPLLGPEGGGPPFWEGRSELAAAIQLPPGQVTRPPTTRLDSKMEADCNTPWVHHQSLEEATDILVLLHIRFFWNIFLGQFVSRTHLKVCSSVYLNLWFVGVLNLIKILTLLSQVRSYFPIFCAGSAKV